MAREKITIRKIDNAAARQVTFSKRRRGLFKKADELSVLRDADVAIIVFSATRKLFSFASSSTQEIIEKYNMHSKNLQNVDQPSLDLQLENSDYVRLTKQVEEASHQLRQMQGEELQASTLEELQLLEKNLETGFSRVLARKDAMIKEQINALEQKGLQLMEENYRLRQKVMKRFGEGKHVTDSGNVFYEDGQSESVTNITQTGEPEEIDDSSDISLKVGPRVFVGSRSGELRTIRLIVAGCRLRVLVRAVCIFLTSCVSVLSSCVSGCLVMLWLRPCCIVDSDETYYIKSVIRKIFDYQ